MAALAPGLDELDHRLDVEPVGALRVDRQAQLRQSSQGRRLGGHRRLGTLVDELVEPGREPPAGGDGRILLAKGSGPAVAWIGVQRQAGLFTLGVDPGELGPGHVDLAASLDRQGLGQPCRDRPDRAQVGADVLAGRAIAARGAQGEPATLEAQADGQAVDLQLGAVAQLGRRFRCRGQAQPTPHAGVKGHAARRPRRHCQGTASAGCDGPR